MRTVDVRFVGSTSYHSNYTYFVPDYLDDLKAGDWVIIDVSGEPKTAKVIYSPSVTPGKATKGIAQRVDLKDYFAHVASVKKKADIIKKLAALEKEQNEFVRFEILAKNNPEAAELLRQLKEI